MLRNCVVGVVILDLRNFFMFYTELHFSAKISGDKIEESEIASSTLLASSVSNLLQKPGDPEISATATDGNFRSIQATQAFTSALSSISSLREFTGYLLPTTSASSSSSTFGLAAAGYHPGSSRPRMGGSTMKTAKVWRYFIQLPSAEQAAECRLCCKRIKATNSSTTGMIRHLRSCHADEYQALQAARQNGNTPNPENHTLHNRQLNNDAAKNKRKDMTGHMIHNIISSAIEHKRSGTEDNDYNVCMSMNVDRQPIQKKGKFDECSSAVDLRTERPSSANRKEQTEKIRKVKENFWPDDHPEARQITEQIAMMLLLDSVSPAILDRTGFRNLLRFFQPKYQLPSAERFQKVILPNLSDQLKVGSASMDNNSFGNQQNEMGGRLNRLTMALLRKKRNIIGGGSVSDENASECSSLYANLNTEENDLDRVVINSIRSAQNISQSFSHSIQLGDDDSDSGTDSEQSLSTRIQSFIKYIGECVFPEAELTDLLTRCYYAYHYMMKHDAAGDDEQSQLGFGAKNSSSRNMDLGDYVNYVQKNLEHIHHVHERSPIPMFKSFTPGESQFLSDLNMHIQSL